VWVRGRIENIKKKGKLCFFLLRQQMHSLQAIMVKGENDNIQDETFKSFASLPNESIVDVFGKLQQTNQDIRHATLSQVELAVEDMKVVSSPIEKLPVQFDV